MGNTKYNMIGKKFNRLTVLEECKERKERKKVYKCICECGNIVYAIGTRLRNNKVKSCGCLKHDIKSNFKHGKRHTRLYSIWYDMKRKCYKTNRKDYHCYGGRGIKVCDEWLYDFMVFYNWSMSHGYNDNLTIDRIDVNGNYEPSNCRWTDMKTQGNNRRTNILLTYNGETKTMTEWAEYLNIPYSTIKHRHNKKWTDKECLFGKEV